MFGLVQYDRNLDIFFATDALANCKSKALTFSISATLEPPVYATHTELLHPLWKPDLSH